MLALDIKLAAEKNLAVKSQLFIIQQRSMLLFVPSVRKTLCNLGLVKKKKRKEKRCGDDDYSFSIQSFKSLFRP